MAFGWDDALLGLGSAIGGYIGQEGDERDRAQLLAAGLLTGQSAGQIAAGQDQRGRTHAVDDPCILQRQEAGAVREAGAKRVGAIDAIGGQRTHTDVTKE